MSFFGWTLVGLLGGAAACCRYLIDAEISRRTDRKFPVGILLVNTLGAFALGLVAGSTLEGQAQIIVMGGVIGSFATFSTWMLDTHLLATTGMAKLAWLNITLSMAAGLAAVALGSAITG